MNQTNQTEATTVIVAPKRFVGSDWAERIKRARDSREAARQMREGKPITTSEHHYA